MALLTADEISTQLATLPDWEVRGDQLTRTYTLPSFTHAIVFIGAIGQLAEAANHHPDLKLVRLQARHDRTLDAQRRRLNAPRLRSGAADSGAAAEAAQMKTAIITGGGSGIGLATAQALSREGFRVGLDRAAR